MRSWAVAAGLIFLSVIAPAVVHAQQSLGFPLSDTSVPVFHGWLYNDRTDHRGIDYVQPLNTPVLAAADGIAMTSSQLPDPKKDTYGTFVLIRHPNGLSTLYAHLSEVAPGIVAFDPAEKYNTLFDLWTPVKKGDVIGFVGHGGAVYPYDHLHFEVSLNPVGDYTGHVQGKVDPYDIYNTAAFYPPTGVRFTSCGPNFLWVTCGTTPAAPSGKILFSDTSHSPVTTYVTPADAFDPTPVATTASYPAWFPDGKTFAFSDGGGGIFITDIDGGAPRLVIATASGAITVSPDGSRIAFLQPGPFVPSGESNDIYVVNIDGTGLTRVTAFSDLDAQQLSWSPDGGKILFTRTNGSNGAAAWTLWIVKPDGTEAKEFVGTLSARFGAWSRDGQKVAYNVGGSLAVGSSDGASVHVIADNCYYPSWSPDSSRIVCMTFVPFANLDILTADGSKRWTFSGAASPGFEVMPQWSPR